MVFNFFDDSKNLVFRKGSSSVDYVQDEYYLSFKSLYSNKWLKNVTSNNEWDGNNIFYIKLTKVDDNDTYVSFSWDKDDIDGLGTSLPSEYNKEDIDGYYILNLRGDNRSPGFTTEIASAVCKVINDRSTTTTAVYTINKATKEQEEGGEFIYYRP